MKYVSVTALVLLVGIFSVIGGEGVVSYEGTNDCDDMRLTVRFSYNRDAAEIRDFVAEHRCIEGEGAIAWEVPAAITVAGDGSFSYKSPYGSSLSGRIDGDGIVNGELGKGPSIKCADEEFHPTCTAFTAKPKSK